MGFFLAGKPQCEVSACVLPHNGAGDEQSREEALRHLQAQGGMWGEG